MIKKITLGTSNTLKLVLQLISYRFQRDHVMFQRIKLKRNFSDERHNARIINFGGVIRFEELDNTYVDGLRRFLRLFLIFVLLVPFETVFNMQEYLFQLQATEMQYGELNLIDQVSLIHRKCQKIFHGTYS